MYDAPNAGVLELPAGASPGVTNSWPKWASEAKTVNGKTYSLIFSSKRGAAGNPQLYVKS
jgi:hypothetical protein